MEYKTIVAQSDMNPDMGCVFKVKAEDFEGAVELIRDGFFCWFCTATLDEVKVDFPLVYETFGDDYSDEWCYSMGYSEIACEMLDANNIWYDNNDSFARDEEGNFDADLVTEYDVWL